MKNVAKCDTWCELQNPVNHRVFERKLRLAIRLKARLAQGHALRHPLHPVPHRRSGEASSDGPGPSPLEGGAREGESPVVLGPRGAVGESGCLGMQP
ncbi:hypothetical protein RHMOL_RhmolUnG0007500 [Rhododendron molle]|nr:hypothetical protein RHMOL_RhmolUnG0007500 [Rhododendron molle]